MSIWAKAQQLPTESLTQIRAIYGEHFPIEVRHYLAHWIEEKFWINVDPNPDNPQHEQYVAGLVSSLISEIEAKAAVVNNDEYFLVKLKLAEAAKLFRLRYSTNPVQLFKYIRNCLETEMRLIQQVNGEGSIPVTYANNRAADIMQRIEMLRQQSANTEEDLRRMAQELEALALQYHECTKLSATVQQLTACTNHNVQTTAALQQATKQRDMHEQLLKQKVATIMQCRITITEKLSETYKGLSELQTTILDEELINWKRDQQLAGNGAPFNTNHLDVIQDWCESLAELIWFTRQQSKELDRLRQKLQFDNTGVDMIPPLIENITQLLSALVTSTFIIEKQPPQVMKTNTRFTATVRLLVGGKLNVHMTPPQVKVSIISEAQANVLLKSEKFTTKLSNEGSGEILNNTGTMEYQQATRQLTVSFRNMQLKKIKRAEKKGTESVMDEKFSLFFQSSFTVGGGELVFNVWTLSLPVVVIVHGNQEPHAWATVTWDNAFAEQGRTPFAIPDKAPWTKVAETLSLKFHSATGRELALSNLKFLADKAFRGAFNDVNQMLTWAQFCKEPLPERSFTFWEWFYGVMKLTKEHLRSQWVDGSILGFIRKRQAEEMLANCRAGTFLLRFSDSELGGVTIAWVNENAEVFSLQPFTSKDFQIRSLADRISDLQHLLYLYPDTPKDQVFNKYYTPYQDNQPPPNGYVKPILKVSVPGYEGGGISYPNTPQHMFMQSPDPTRDTPSVSSNYSVATGTTACPGTGSMDYFDQLDDINNIDGLVNFDQLMQDSNFRQ